MSVITINVPRDLRGDQAGDIAITAAEGGIGYWSIIDEYRPSRWVRDFDDLSQPSENIDVPEDFEFYRIAEIDEPHKHWSITPRVLARGLELFLTGQHPHAASTGRVLYDMEDFAAMDAGEADMIVQLGLFGRLVYG